MQPSKSQAAGSAWGLSLMQGEMALCPAGGVLLEKQYEGHRSINKLIAEQLPSKMAKQISDKWRGLLKSLLRKKGKDLEWKKKLYEEGEDHDDVGPYRRGGLKPQYRRTISEWLASGKLFILKGLIK